MPEIIEDADSAMAAFTDPKDIVDAFFAALNAGDAEALGPLFTEDAVFVNIMGMRWRSRGEIVACHAWACAGPLRGTRVSVDGMEELRVTDDVTVLHGRGTRVRLPDAPEGALPSGTTMLVLVARRGPKGWQAVAATNVAEVISPGDKH